MRTTSLILPCLLAATYALIPDPHPTSPPPANPPKASISFFGQKCVADTLVFFIDCSASMSWKGELREVKSEIRAALAALGPDQSFAIIGWPQRVFSYLPLSATESNKTLAYEWLGELRAHGGNRATNELDSTLDILEREPGRRRLLLLVSDVGVPHPADWRPPLTRFKARHPESFDLRAFVLSPRESATFQALAEATAGRYVQLP